MKHPVFLLLAFLIGSLIFSINSHAQSKYGKITMEELNMTSYPQDTTASAVILSKTGKTRFEYSDISGGFLYDYTVTVKIKILKNDGLDLCNHSIFYTDLGNRRRDEIRNLSGTTYNLENGKITKTKLSKEYIFDEDYDEELKLKKFTMPAAKVGSVIEYKYSIISPFTYDLREFKFQSEDAPTAYTSYVITIPEYFYYAINYQGYERVDSKSEKINDRMAIRYEDYNGRMQTMQDAFTSEEKTFTAKNIPTMKAEPLMWAEGDYITKISFELKSFQFKHGIISQHSTSWEKIDETLFKSKHFGGNLKRTGLFKNDVTKGDITLENASKIQSMIRERVKWNEKGNMNPSNLNDALKNGLGSAADMNFLLINALKAADFDAFPVVLSTRANGRVPFINPSILAFNYTIVGVKIDDKVYFTDASSKYANWNVLPGKCLVRQARIMNEKKTSWIDLTPYSTGTEYINSQYSFVDGQYHGKTTEMYRAYSGYNFRNNYFNSHTDKDNYIEKLGSRLTSTINNFEISGEQIPGADLKVSYETQTDIALGDDYLYINPLLVKHTTENPFKTEERKYPVDFHYLPNYIQIVDITIPEGYAVEELPKSERFLFGDEGDIVVTYKAEEVNGHIKLHYQFQLKTLLIAQTEYVGLRDFFAKVVLKNSEQVVLKKIEK